MDISKRLTVKDLATIGIFSALMIVVFIAFSIVTGASLFFNMIFNAVFTALILAPFFVYMTMIPWFLAGGLLAEASMIGKDSYRNIKRITAAWIITSLTRAAHGMSEIWFFKDAFIKAGVSPEQVAVQTKYYTSLQWILISLIATIIAALIGCWLGNKLMAKHFKKAGLL